MAFLVKISQAVNLDSSNKQLGCLMTQFQPVNGFQKIYLNLTKTIEEETDPKYIQDQKF